MTIGDTGTINMRVQRMEKERIQRAAKLADVSVSAFVLSAAEEKASRVIAEHATTVVPADFFDALYARLDDQAVPNAAMVAAADATPPAEQR